MLTSNGDCSIIIDVDTTSADNGAWLSLVEHLAWDQGVAGSNPAAPTIAFKAGFSDPAFSFCIKIGDSIFK